MKAIKAADDHELLPLADLLVQHGHAQEAEWLVEDRAGKVHGTHLLEWLKRRAVERNDKPAALKLAEQQFMLRPSVTEYLSACDDWPARPRGRSCGKMFWPTWSDSTWARS